MTKEQTCKCGSDKCDGFILFHPSELNQLQDTKDKILKDNPRSTFDLIDSPSSGETYVKFKELHVCYNGGML